MSFRLQSFTRVPAIGLQTILFSAVLAACGGGGGGDATSSDAAANAGSPVASSTSDTSASTAAPVDSSATSTATTTTTTPPADAAAADNGSTGTVAATDNSGTSTDSTVADPADSSALDMASTTATVLSATTASTNASASGYFVNAAVGSDSNPGTASAPFKTLARLSSVALKAGQGIYLHCGDVWRESLALTSKQLVDGSLLGAYGTVCNTTLPRITGADDFSKGWSAGANGVWSRPVPANTPKIARLFVNGTALRTAQWPNYIGPGNETAAVSTTAAASTNTLTANATDLAALAGKDLVGATALVHSVDWTVEPETITAFDSGSGRMTFGASTLYGVTPAVTTYALQDKLWMLDSVGEFYHDTANNMLYMIPSSAQVTAGINASQIEGAVRDSGLTLSNRASLGVSQIQVDMERQNGVEITNSPNAKLNHLIVTHNARAGIRVTAAVATGSNRNAQIDSSSITDNGLVAIDGATTNRVSVIDNWVSNTGSLAWSGNTVAAVSLGDGAIATGNQVLHSGYSAIRFAGGDNSNVSSNVVTDYCMRLPDCGGIYSWFGNKTTVSPYAQSSVVANNRITGTVVGNGSLLVSGIYLDEFTRGSTVRNNTIVGGAFGIYVHNGSKHTISNNQLWLNQAGSLRMGADQLNVMTGNVISGNQLVPVSTATGAFPALPQFSTGYAIKYYTSATDFSEITSGVNSFSNNQILTLQPGSAPAVYTSNGLGQKQNLSGQSWKSYAPNDVVATPPAQFKLVKTVTGAELETNGDFSDGLTNWAASFRSTGGALLASAVGGCTGACAEFTATTVNDFFASKPFPIVNGTMYVIDYTSVFATSAATIAKPYIAMRAAPYSDLSSSDGFTFMHSMQANAGDTLNVEYFFHASGSATAVADLKLGTIGVPVAFDNVSVKAVTGYAISKAANWASAAIAPVNAPQTFDCAALGWSAGCSVIDTSGKAVSMPVTVPANSAMLLLRADSAYKQ